MRTAIKETLLRIAGRHPQAASQLKLVARAFAFHRQPSERENFDNFYSPMSGVCPVNDLPTCFAARAILERRYKSLIEIGTSNGTRVVALKRMFPDIDISGVDIQERFNEPFVFENVKFGRFDLASLRTPSADSAILSFGVMMCMNSQQLSEFLAACAAGGRDIVFREMTPAFKHQGTLQRDGMTWYHDFDAEFSKHGYRLLGPRDRGQASQFDINFFDLGYFNVATLSAN